MKLSGVSIFLKIGDNIVSQNSYSYSCEVILVLESKGLL